MLRSHGRCVPFRRWVWAALALAISIAIAMTFVIAIALLAAEMPTLGIRLGTDHQFYRKWNT